MREIPPFFKRVYRELCKVPAGQTISYAELARRAGSPGAARAVGQAMARNPHPITIPCHRVVASSGKLGGYSGPGGVAAKRRLLKREGAYPGRVKA